MILSDCALPCDLTGSVSRQDQYPSAHGGFSDVWVGTWVHSNENVKVAIKVLRPQTYDEAGKSKVDKRLRRELHVWRELRHDNIVPLYGIVSDFGPYVSMVSPWMDNGNLNKYLECQASTLTSATRFELLREIATGLQYLHSLDIIHGDLTGANVFISRDGRACLSDFGLSTIIAEFQGTSYFTSSIHGNIRWSAPELYRIDSVPSVTFFSDVYSFGSVMLQVLTGCIPYHYLKSDVQVLICLLNRVRPERPPENVTDLYWGFIQRCWVNNPRARPSVNEVLAAITFFYHGLLNKPRLNSNVSSDSTFTSESQHSISIQRASPTSPLLLSQALTACSKHAVNEPVWAVSPRVLLVDDDAVFQKLSTRLLRIFGCTIDVATDGVAAVNKMNTAIYDLVFMDIMMPKLDGISATCLIRKFDSFTPIISMTSNSRQNDVQVYYTSGMNDILCKPFGKEGILMILEKYLVHLKAIHELPDMRTASSLNIPRQLKSAPAGALGEAESTMPRPGPCSDISRTAHSGEERSTSNTASLPLLPSEKPIPGTVTEMLRKSSNAGRFTAVWHKIALLFKKVVHRQRS